MKKWIDASIIAEKSEVSWDLVKYETLMKQKPNFDKSKINDYKHNKKLDRKNNKKGVKGCFKNG